MSNAPDAAFITDRLLYRDGLMLVLNKPPGIAVHGGPSLRARGEESLENYFDALRFGLPRPPALAHRLDRDTSGCLVLGRHPKALRKLGRLFQDGAIEKTYLAVTSSPPEKLSGRIDAPLAKEGPPHNWKMVIDDAGKPSSTTYRVIAQDGDQCAIEARPKTGRTHQIRVHLASIGAPIAGDRLYGDAGDAPRTLLHAVRIVVPISKSKKPIRVEAPVPVDMLNAAPFLRDAQPQTND